MGRLRILEGPAAHTPDQRIRMTPESPRAFFTPTFHPATRDSFSSNLEAISLCTPGPKPEKANNALSCVPYPPHMRGSFLPSVAQTAFLSRRHAANLVSFGFLVSNRREQFLEGWSTSCMPKTDQFWR